MEAGPRSPHRLANPARLAVKIGVFAAASVLLAAAGLPWWAAAFFVASAALNVLAERSADAGPGSDQTRPSGG
jgi:Protein of unknown function (DUF2568)